MNIYWQGTICLHGYTKHVNNKRKKKAVDQVFQHSREPLYVAFIFFHLLNVDGHIVISVGDAYKTALVTDILHFCFDNQII